MRTLQTLKTALSLALLASTAGPLAAMETGPQSRAGILEAEPIRLDVLAFNPGRADGYFLLERPFQALPDRDVDVFWLDEDRDDWVRTTQFRITQGRIVILDPAPRGTDLDFLVMVQGKAWARAFYEGSAGEAERQAAMILSQGQEEEAAARALMQPLPEPSGDGEGPDTEAWEEEELASGSVPSGSLESASSQDSGTEDEEPGNGDSDTDDEATGAETPGTYLKKLLTTFGLTQAEVAQEAEGTNSISSALSEILNPRPNQTYRTMSYSKAERIAAALNKLNRAGHLREAPFTAEELYLAGRPLQSLSPRHLFDLIMRKDRYHHGYGLRQQAQRLEIKASTLTGIGRGVFGIKPSLINNLKGKLDLPALRLTEADLERTRCEAFRRFLDHPGNVRAMELFHKAQASLGVRSMTEFSNRSGVAISKISEIRSGTHRVTMTPAQRLSDFHNRAFPQEPPTTPAYFMGL